MNDNALIWEAYVGIVEESMGIGKGVFYGWISPEGKLYPNLHGDSHYDTLEKIMKEINFRSNDKTYEELYELGYCRLVYVMDIVYIGNSIKPPTAKQVKEIKDLCIERGMNQLWFDNDERERRLWIRER